MRNGRRNVAEANARFATPENIPIGWRAGSLGEVAGLQSGYAFKSTWFATEGIRLLRGTNIEPGGIRWNDVVYMPTHRIGDFERYQLNAGDVVIAMDRPIISAGLKVAVLRENDVPSLLLQRVGRFQCSDVLDSSFLYQYLNSEHFIRHIERQATGTQLPHISGTDIETAPLPLPPLNEQRRIVAKLDALQERSRRARASLDAVPALLDKLRQSILAAAFRGDLTRDFREQHKDLEPASKLLQRIRTERRKKWEEAELAKLKAKGKAPTDDKWKAKYKEPDPVDPTGLPTLPDGWCWAKAEEVCDLITKGTTPSADKLTHVGDVPFLKVYNLTFNGTVDFSVDPTFVAAETHHGFLARSRVFPGDVLMNIVGPPLGKVGIVPDLFPEWNMNQAIAVFRSITGLHREFLANYLLSAQSVQRAVREGKATAGQLNLTLEICRDLPLPLCSEMEQRQIILALSTAMRSCQAVSMDAETASERLSSLDRAILAKAFRGELVPQDPRDEPADELLARVRADQAAPSTPRGRKRAAEAALHD